MLQIVLFIFMVASSALWGEEVCNKAIETNALTCEKSRIDPIFQRAHKTSPRSHSLIFDLSQTCVNGVAECFTQCKDDRFAHGNKFDQVLLALRKDVGAWTPQTEKCRQNLRNYAKSMVKVCEKFKVHQSAAADVTDAQQRILSEHCSKFSVFLTPIKKDQDKEGIKKSSIGSHSGGKGREENGENSPLELGELNTENSLSLDENTDTATETQQNSQNIEISARGVRQLPLPDKAQENKRSSGPKKSIGLKKSSKKTGGFVVNAPASFQQLGVGKKKGIKRRAARPSLSKEKAKLAGKNFHATKNIPDPGSGQAISVGKPSAQPVVGGAVVQQLQQKLREKVSGVSESFRQEQKQKGKEAAPEVFNETKRTFRHFRRQNQFIED